MFKELRFSNYLPTNEQHAKILFRILLDIITFCIPIYIRNPYCVATICLFWIVWEGDYFNSKSNQAIAPDEDQVRVMNSNIDKQRGIESIMKKIKLLVFCVLTVSVMNIDIELFAKTINLIKKSMLFVYESFKTEFTFIEINLYHSINNFIFCVYSYFNGSDSIMIDIEEDFVSSINDTSIIIDSDADVIIINISRAKLLISVFLLWLLSIVEIIGSNLINKRSFSFSISELNHCCFNVKKFDRNIISNLNHLIDERIGLMRVNNDDNIQEDNKHEPIDQEEVNHINELKLRRNEYVKMLIKSRWTCFILHGMTLLLSILIVLLFLINEWFSLLWGRLMISVLILFLCPITTNGNGRIYLDDVQDIIHMMGMVLFCYVPTSKNLMCIQKITNMLCYSYLFATTNYTSESTYKFRISSEAKILRNALDIWSLTIFNFKNI
jgi:hypothetical protein